MKRLVISGTGSYLPERVVHNDELSLNLDTSHEWILSHTGIESRHIVDEEDSNSDMAARAGQAALEKAGIEAKDLGMVLVATSTGDFGTFPATACIVQQLLGAKDAGAFDIQAACTGFVYGLEIMRGLAYNNPKPMLLIGSEVLSRIVDWHDRNTCVLFGDGAGAAVLTSEEADADDLQNRGVIDSIMRAKGSGAKYLYREGGTRPHQEGHHLVTPTVVMEGRAVFAFAIKAIAEVIQHFLTKYNLTSDDVKYVVPHQANYRILKAAAAKLPIPEEKFYLNVREMANTSAASVPIALDQMNNEGMLEQGDLIITVGFGGGLTYGGNLIRW